MIKHLIFALRYYPLLMIGSTILTGYAVYGLNQEPMPNSEVFTSGVSMFGDFIYYVGLCIAFGMLVYAWANSVPVSQQIKYNKDTQAQG